MQLLVNRSGRYRPGGGGGGGGGSGYDLSCVTCLSKSGELQGTRSIQDPDPDPDPDPDADVTTGKLLNVLKSTRCDISVSFNIKVCVPANVSANL